MEDILLDQFEAELVSTQTSLSEADAEYQRIAELRNDLARDRDALLQLISSRRKRLGQAIPSATPPTVVTSPALGAPDTTQISEGEAAQHTTSKAEFVRQVLKQNPGITPAQIRQQATGIIPLTRAFPYTILHQWKNAGKIKERGGRYYWQDLGAQ